MSKLVYRLMRDEDRDTIGQVMCVSGNYWNAANGHGKAFSEPELAAFQFDVYKKLDVENLGYVAIDEETGAMAGLSFMHLRPTHVSLGTLNIHPNWFGRGVARGLVDRIIDFAESHGKPVRLISSAANIDSYALYNRAGFVPILTYQQMYMDVPEAGLDITHEHEAFVRDATLDDVPQMAALERELAGVDRTQDYEYLIRNEDGVWHMSVYESPKGEIEGFLCSIDHPLGNWMLGPGAARDDNPAAALILTELKQTPGRRVLFLYPNNHTSLTAQAYSWGAKVMEIQMQQVLGLAKPMEGLNFPAFVPETG